ncbi:unnamed protein product [Clavelina lepadiformis]|uniref:Uncharacterized protein n=1 Tax=Clavelina lepadiformis TaxID=159417 RepID=A0ABP0G726_CLALP
MFGVLVLFLLMCQPRPSMEEVKVLAPLSTTSQSGRIDFTDKHKATPKVFAWARPHDGRRYRRYKTVVDQVDTRGFHYTVTRTDNPHGTIHTAIWLYWITSHPELTQKSKTFGDEWKGKTLDIPHVTWFSTPSISKTSHNTFTVLGRKILIGQVHKMLQNLVKRESPITQTPSNEFKIELTIRGDIIYMDDDVNFQGLKKLEIYARKLISNGNTLTLTAPTDSTKLTDGKNGKSGSDSPEVDVYLHELLGNIKVITRASNGKMGQNGKDGVNGEDRKWKSPPLNKAAVCKNFYSSHSDKRYLFIDNPGPNGGPGGNGEKAGLSGNGGTASRVNLYIVNSTGQFNLNQFSGKGGNPAQHGYGGKGGQGGPGACGVICGDSEICQYGFMYPSCYSVGNPCADPVHGKNGHPGLDGFVVNPLPEWGKDGIVGGGYFTEVANVKKWFTNDTDLLQVIQRRGESLFLRNKKSEALEDFEFIESVTDEDSDMYQQASYLSNAIAQGFDYYGNDKEYAPDLDWFYLRNRVMTSLEAGKSFEDAYNQVKNKIELVDEVQGALRSIVTISNQKIERQVAFENNELENQKMLYVRALKVLEHRMITLTKQIETLVQDIINEKVKSIPREKITTVLGAIVGFVVKLRKEEIPAALANIWTIVDTITSKNHCKLPTIKQALASAKERLTFGVNYEYVGPEKIDFTKMDVSAVPVIMKSDLGKNKGQLVQEFSCILGSNKSPEEQQLNGLIETFFRDGDLRINQIDLLLNINIKLQV